MFSVIHAAADALVQAVRSTPGLNLLLMFGSRAHRDADTTETISYNLSIVIPFCKTPRGFLARFPKGAVIDEAQHCALLLSYLQARVDSSPRRGEFRPHRLRSLGVGAGLVLLESREVDVIQNAIKAVGLENEKLLAAPIGCAATDRSQGPAQASSQPLAFPLPRMRGRGSG